MKMIQTDGQVLGKEDLLRMESVLYAFAMKFLPEAELDEMKEVFAMTKLGQMLEEKGIEKGTRQSMDLTKQLIADARIDDLKRAAEDGVFREKLYKEYGIDK